MKRKFPLLWRWCLVLAMLVNTIAPAWASAAMTAEMLGRHQAQAQVDEAGHAAMRTAPKARAACGSESQDGWAGTASEHEGCDCDATGTCTCPCTLSVKLIDMRVQFAARHLLSTAPARAIWESADPGPLTSLLRPPIA